MTAPDRRPADDPVAGLTDLLNQLAGTGTPAPAVPADAAVIPTESAGEPEPMFANLDDFVCGHLAHVVERRISTGAAAGMYWCPRWWAHPEAISRLYALWRAWETLRVADPQTGMSTWWLHHLDPHLAALASEYGPFTRCRPDKHTDPPVLPTHPTPKEVLDQLPDSRLALHRGPAPERWSG